jgi:hypothetical protein
VLAPAQTVSTLPEGWSADPPTEVYSRPSHAAELLLSADGRFCYVSNRGHDSVVVFAVAAGSGRLEALQWVPSGGRVPWAMCFVGGAAAPWLVVQNTHCGGGGRDVAGGFVPMLGPSTVAAFARDAGTGRLRFADAGTVPEAISVVEAPLAAGGAQL